MRRPGSRHHDDLRELTTGGGFPNLVRQVALARGGKAALSAEKALAMLQAAAAQELTGRAQHGGFASPTCVLCAGRRAAIHGSLVLRRAFLRLAGPFSDEHHVEWRRVDVCREPPMEALASI